MAANKKEVEKQLIEVLMKNQQIHENSKYGEFIIQTNEVQWVLVNLILIRAKYLTPKLQESLERSELGNLIIGFGMCIRTFEESGLLKLLQKYKDSRNALAHKMLTDKKLTINECKVSIKLGTLILNSLREMLKSDIASFKSRINKNESKQV